MPKIELDVSQDALRQILLDANHARAASMDAVARTLLPAELAALRPHVINLSEGQFRRSGQFDSTEQDVDAIFQQHLPQWLASFNGDKPRIVIYAHGGLVGESDGLAIARKHIDWWKKNRVYPIYFVWETSFFDAIQSILRSIIGKLPGFRGFDVSQVSDPIVEEGCRALGGVKIWGAMKANAERASQPDGGARYFAKQLAAFWQANKQVELHAVGHSAGSIFHNHFIPVALAEGIPAFESLQFLAPALRIDEFKRHAYALFQNPTQIKSFTTFTMNRQLEEADTCINIYKKSLLYLIHNALEASRDVPILGLEVSIRSDPEMKRLFGLDGRAGALGSIVWSKTSSGGRDSSEAEEHGYFDDDSPTMSSVVARILGTDAAPVPYPSSAKRAMHTWPVSTDWLLPFDLSDLATPPSDVFRAGWTSQGQAQAETTGATTNKTSRRRIALCVGIDEYPAPHNLSGCVNDANAWGRVLGRNGFEVRKLINGEATYAAIKAALGKLISDGDSGDVLVFHYSGHGVELPDSDGDEKQDQSFVPVDFSAGAFLLDDETNQILNQIRPGVHLTVFADCCHSATITRALGAAVTPPPVGSKARRLIATQDQVAAHMRFRADLRRRGMSRGSQVARSLRWVNFSACDKTELAYEYDGQGAFTRVVTELLGQPLKGITNSKFQQQILERFGDNRAQSPKLDMPNNEADAPVLAGII